MNKLRQWAAWLVTGAHPYVVLLIAIAIISHLQWFNPFSILEFGDWQYRPDEHVRELLTAWNAWVPFNNFGEVNILMSGFPFRGLAWSMITRVGLSYDIATKLTLFWPVAIGGFLTPFLLGQRLFKDNLIAFALALFYGTTTYILIIQTAHLPIAIVYMLMPLLLYFLDKAMDENRLRDWIILTLLFCVGIFYEVRMMYMVAFVLAAYFAVFAFTRAVNVKYYLKPIGICVGLLVLANIFWILPTKIAAVSSIGDVASRGLFGDSLFNILQSITLMKWNWTGTLIDRTFTAQPIPLHLWLIPLIVGAGIVFAEKYRKRMLFFLIITVFGLLLSKQSAEPFPFLYHWLYNNFPGFILFREASKFYVLVAFGYFGLLGYGLVALRQRDFKIGQWRKAYGYYAGIALILLVAIVNLKPAVTTELGGTFKQAHMPSDYQKLRDFIAPQPEYFRTYWVPRESWWGYYDNQHPKVRGVDMLQKDWQPFLKTLGSNHGYDLARSNIAIFQQPYAAELFRSGAVKYVIVPLRDRANDDDFFGSYGDDRQYYVDALNKVPFLHKVDIGTREVAVYENTQFSPYIGASDQLYDLPQKADLPTQLPLLFEQFGTHFHVLEKGERHADNRAGTGAFAQLFTADERQSQPGKVTQHTTVAAKTDLVADIRKRHLQYNLAGNELTITQQQSGTVKVNGHTVYQGAQQPKVLSQMMLQPTKEYLVGFDETLVPVERKQPQRSLGTVESEVNVYTAQPQNLIANPSFEQGLWQKEVGDCNNYSHEPQLGMQRGSSGALDGGHYLQLAANRHTACTHQEHIGVNGGATYIFSFAYQNEGGQKAGYKLRFNDAKRTEISDELPINDEQWHTLTRKITVPAGATTMSVEVMGYPDEDHFFNSLTRYDSFRLSPLQSLVTIPAASSTELLKVSVAAGPATFSYEDSRYDYANLIPDPSFEQGLWQKEVGDCNNYDQQAVIGMNRHRGGSDGKHSLQLEAAKHIACTGPNAIQVKENATYSFRFDYQSDNADQASYYVTFNDPARTTIQDSLPIKDKKWQSFAKEIKAPWGATTMSISVYAKPNTYSTQKVAVRYDNFKLVALPPALTSFHLASEPPQPMTPPQKVTYKIVGPTKKTAHITGATTPFYLTMSESYDKGWRVELADSKAKGIFNSWWPLAHPTAIPASQHEKLNGYLNTWYIDPAQFCGHSSACHHNADGSYDMSVIIEYKPQRWFVTGVAVSAITFAGMGGYLLVKRRQRLRGKKDV